MTWTWTYPNSVFTTTTTNCTVAPLLGTTMSLPTIASDNVHLRCGCISRINGQMKKIVPLCIFHDTYVIEETP